MPKRHKLLGLALSYAFPQRASWPRHLTVVATLGVGAFLFISLGIPPATGPPAHAATTNSLASHETPDHAISSAVGREDRVDLTVTTAPIVQGGWDAAPVESLPEATHEASGTGTLVIISAVAATFGTIFVTSCVVRAVRNRERLTPSMLRAELSQLVAKLRQALGTGRVTQDR